MHYMVTATAVKLEEGWVRTIQVPTFILDSGIQGIISIEQAKRIGIDIINPTRDTTITVNIHVIECNPCSSKSN